MSERDVLAGLDLGSEESVRAWLRTVPEGSLLHAAGLLWLGDLDSAHRVFQDDPSDLGSYWHGVLHRAEGDTSNARYWFRRSGDLAHRLGLDPFALTDAADSRTLSRADLEHEWRALAEVAQERMR